MPLQVGHLRATTISLLFRVSTYTFYKKKIVFFFTSPFPRRKRLGRYVPYVFTCLKRVYYFWTKPNVLLCYLREQTRRLCGSQTSLSFFKCYSKTVERFLINPSRTVREVKCFQIFFDILLMTSVYNFFFYLHAWGKSFWTSSPIFVS